MLTLEQQQRALLAMLTGAPVTGAETSADLLSDPWLKSVAASPGLKATHRIAGWWQRFQLESQCRYTTRLLKRRRCFEQYVEDHFRLHPMPPSIEEMTAQFLSAVAEEDDPLLSAVAKFERACLELQESATVTRVILWDRDPNLVLSSLDTFTPLPGVESGFRFVLTLGGASHGGASCVREAYGSDICETNGGEVRESLHCAVG